MPRNPLMKLFNIYLEPQESNDELEVKFFTRNREKISRIDFNNVIQTLKSKGFSIIQPTGKYLLRIQNEFIERKTGTVKMSNIRTEITSLSNIQEYCRKNNFTNGIPPPDTIFYQKRAKVIDGERVYPVNYDDFHFRVDIKEENLLKKNEIRVRSLLQKWDRHKKIFRFIKRFTFTHPQYPLKVDCSIVKSSTKMSGHFVPAYTMQEAGVFNNPEGYEIEIEMDSVKQLKKTHDTTDDLIEKMKKVIRIILGGFQQTNFPIGQRESDNVLKEYMKLLKKKMHGRIHPKDFIGPSSISLEIVNIMPLNNNSKIPNIRNPYTVTEKADGLRKIIIYCPQRKNLPP